MIEDDRLEKKLKFVEFLSRNPFYRHACWFVGISEQTLSRWRDEDDDFRVQCESMRAQSLSKYVNRSSPDFILTHADPETFNTAKKIDITSGGKPIHSILSAIKEENVQHNDSNKEVVEVK